MADEIADGDAAMRTFCQKVGELIAWTSAIDAQLAKAVIRACTLSETPMLEPIVAELGTRAKIDILRARATHIKPVSWSRGITAWLNKVAKVTDHRNIVAHHQVAISDGKLTLYSAQARKVLRNIKDLKPAPAKTIDDVNGWVQTAQTTYVRGQNVLANLDRLAHANAKGS